VRCWSISLLRLVGWPRCPRVHSDIEKVGPQIVLASRSSSVAAPFGRVWTCSRRVAGGERGRCCGRDGWIGESFRGRA
jgi:hypothetical protein